MVGAGAVEPHRIVRQWRTQGQSGGSRSDYVSLVERQTEGQINKLKLVKRHMYGRGKLDLLQARAIDSA